MASQPIAQSGASGSLSCKPAPEDRLIPQTLNFIHAQLPAWRDDPKRPVGDSEKPLNSTLCDFLDIRSRSHFWMVRFKHEEPQAKGRTADMGVHGTEDDTLVGTFGYDIYHPFMVIEAKRLPSPRKDREREYVCGIAKASGGIQRFKLGLHGKDVETAAIVGYIEKQSARHWHATINTWIGDLASKKSADGCVWTDADVLGELICDEEQGLSATESNHQREGKCLTNSIHLHHFWVIMSAGKL
jgi:hypothetical protein